MSSPDFTVCLVTRGDVDLTPILAPLASAQQHWLVWDNSKRVDLAVFGRYAAAMGALTDIVYVQDDDCVLEIDSIRELVDAHEPGLIAANMPQPFRHDFYEEHALVGFGAVFERQLAIETFRRYYDRAPSDVHAFGWDAFLRTCDVPFTCLNEVKRLDVPYWNLPHATSGARMYRQPNHLGERREALRIALAAR